MTLEHLNEVMAIALENAREGVTVTDATLPDNPLIYVNQGFLHLTGYRYEEVIHRNPRFLHGNKGQQPGLETLRQAIRNGQPTVVEIQNQRKDGSFFWTRISLTPVRDAEGRLRHFVGIQEDITHQKDKEALSYSLHQQQLIARVTMEAQEQERRHIGEELHDNINQLLATAKLYLTMAGTTLSTGTSIAHAKTYLDDAIAEIRQLSARLVSKPVQQPLFGEQVAKLLDSLRPVVPFQLLLRNDIRDEAALCENTRLLLYRIIQEQLNNIIKYAHAQTVTVVLKATASGIMLQVADDGIGFDPDQQHKGIGFHNMRSRLKSVHGRLVLHTAPGEGCRLLVKVPLHQEQFA